MFVSYGHHSGGMSLGFSTLPQISPPQRPHNIQSGLSLFSFSGVFVRAKFRRTLISPQRAMDETRIWGYTVRYALRRDEMYTHNFCHSELDGDFCISNMMILR